MLRKTNTDFMLLTPLFSLWPIGSLWAITDQFVNYQVFPIEVHYFISFEDGLFYTSKNSAKINQMKLS